MPPSPLFPPPHLRCRRCSGDSDAVTEAAAALRSIPGRAAAFSIPHPRTASRVPPRSPACHPSAFGFRPQPRPPAVEPRIPGQHPWDRPASSELRSSPLGTTRHLSATPHLWVPPDARAAPASLRIPHPRLPPRIPEQSPAGPRVAGGRSAPRISDRDPAGSRTPRRTPSSHLHPPSPPVPLGTARTSLGSPRTFPSLPHPPAPPPAWRSPAPSAALRCCAAFGP